MKTINFLLAVLLCTVSATAQNMFKYFTPDDFAARRAKLMEQIGDGVAVLQGADLTEAYIKFRQDNNFYYLTGVEMPWCALIINGKTKTTTLFVPEGRFADIKDEALITPGPDAAKMYKVNNVLPKSAMTNMLAGLAGRGQTFYVLTSPEETAEMSRDRCTGLRNTRLSDPWDGRISKELTFINKLKERFPMITIKDLTPVMDEMRWVKDAKEIAVIRECGKIGAHGFDEAMRVTRPGIYEYQVAAAADFVFENEGAMGPSYFPIAASAERGLSWHYNANNHTIKAGDVMMMDYAPELQYYSTDITRTWPVEGKFTGIQLKYYNCVKEASEAVIAAMKPGITVKQMNDIAKGVYAKYGYEKMYPGGIGHYVGMAVHDVGPYDKPFVPGVVFNVEPILEDKNMKLHIRLEDTIIITADGHENVTASTTTDPEAMYKLVKEKGIGEK
ncbi:Xaa-Pro peptidase family protein [Mucilaginibacter sp. L3T2-6]|uniref:M24 family metallopeptidase n=1 Tax=Mucilaginibacter sp. L3T2-6 TaxID=3062491 RepID=UPI0026751793|nr:Xaa-Pro peptidase family protein [Mucilaginibacter sp. L3T2-6]MDO3642151.1 Xaa-Pro peptidase family protein [Mucilaginibacter sp. L3T2-6]MDV6214646.1 Xaa-Pro peptidase family protein [Mucilaginibacter sp. L3T2-6]